MSRSIAIYTIGHSNQTSEQFIALLQQHEIATLVDIRRFPGSRTFPQFNERELGAALAANGIEYLWLEALGGRRATAVSAADSPNMGWRNQSFRNYADYMLTSEFRAGVADLLAAAVIKRTAIMCAESVFWRCHRRLVSDYLTANGHSVWHIFPAGEAKPHTLTAGARVASGQVTYPGEKMLFD